MYVYFGGQMKNHNTETVMKVVQILILKSSQAEEVILKSNTKYTYQEFSKPLSRRKIH